jgi:methyl-accepting chemotaxis protein
MTLVAEETPSLAGLSGLADDLHGLLVESENEMERLSRDFEDLAGEAGALVEESRVVVGCVESERMAAVLPAVEQLGSAAQTFIHQRLDGTAGILETVTGEERLLVELTDLTRGQKAIVRETGMLRVLTNIEVARLGEVGAGFQYLAHELDEFSRSVARSTGELMERTEERRKAIGETRRTLSAALPGMREEFARINGSLGKAIGEVRGTLGELRQTPVRFRSCVEEVAAQIAGVVAAIQVHDITRQQTEHVVTALRRIGDSGAGEVGSGETDAGLAIQSYQLRNVAQTGEGWLTQIRSCLDGMGRIASSELRDLGRLVIAQESAVSGQLTRIEQLEAECEGGDAQVQASFAGITGLMQLVTEHLARSKSVRDRLQLLMFNSIVEASHLGTQADGILEISTTIKRLSADWAEITSRSETTTAQIRELVEASHATVRAFSEEGYAPLRKARAGTEAGLEVLREAAQCAETRGREVERAVLGLQAKIAEVRSRADRLEEGFQRLHGILDAIEAARRATDGTGARMPEDAEAAERRFSSEYTTEIERAILRAALNGGPMPPAQLSFAGNIVELF